MRQKTVLVTARDVFTGDVLCDLVEHEHIGKLCPLCHNGPSALSSYYRYSPHYIILDLQLPGINSLDILEEIHKGRSHPQILCHCQKLNTMLGVKAVHFGATGLIDKDSNLETYRKVISKVAYGMKSYPEEIQELVKKNDYEKHPQDYSKLTRMQKQILILITRGLNNSQMALNLKISVKTVEYHKNKLKTKFGLTSMAEIVSFAVRNGVCEKEETLCL